MQHSTTHQTTARSLKIGVFDSGLGGLSVVRALIDLIDQSASPLIIDYVADSNHAPYGEKSHHFIIERSKIISNWLIERQIDVLVIACNTATTHAISELRTQHPNLLIVGVEPGIKPASEQTKTGYVGVIATQATLNSARFKLLTQRHGSQCQFICQVGHGWVEAVEQGHANSHTDTQTLIRQVLEPINQSPADVLVLGCTHYPFLNHHIQKIAPHYTVIDTSNAIAQQVSRLVQNTIFPAVVIPPKAAQLNCFTTGSAQRMQSFLSYLKLAAQTQVSELAI
jgi:glutamate racemase